MSEIISLGIPLGVGSELLSKFKVIGDIRNKFPDLKIIRYTYKDPTDGILKTANPLDNLPIVGNGYIIVSGDMDTIDKFVFLASPK
jgi:hypothetical protein